MPEMRLEANVISLLRPVTKQPHLLHFSNKAPEMKLQSQRYIFVEIFDNSLWSH